MLSHSGGKLCWTTWTKEKSLSVVLGALLLAVEKDEVA